MREVDVCTSDRLSVEVSGTGALIGTNINAHWGASCFFRFVRIRSRAERSQYRRIQRKQITNYANLFSCLYQSITIL